MKKTSIAVLSLIIIVFMSFQPVFASEIETYKSATEYDYPPFSVTSSGEADGFSVELLQEVMNVMNLRVTFKIDQWSILKEELKNGKIDILPLVGYTKDRDEVYDFTVPYIIMHGNIFIRKDNDTIKTEEDLYDKEVLVMEGDNAQEYAISIGLSENLVLTESYEEAFRLLESGKYDAILAQSLVGQQLINDLNIKNIKAATNFDRDGKTEIETNLSGFEQKFCFAVKEGNSELLAKLNEGLIIVSANGTFAELYAKWFPFLIENKLTFIEMLTSSMVIVIPLIILILLINIFYTRKQIKFKTEELEETHKDILLMESKLRNQQKLESIGVLASGVAHEINNPLNGILNYSQLIADIAKNKDENCDISREDVDEYSAEIIKETNRISKIVSNLLQFSRKEGKAFSKSRIKDIVEDILSLINTLLTREQILIDVKIPEDISIIECRPQQIQQVIMNLLTNSKDALNQKYPEFDDNKRINLRAENIKLNNQDGIRITIEDFGTGMSEDTQNSIFDPFFTTKGRTEGTGLGLSISYGIVKDHNGELSVETEEGIYTKFYVDLPVKQDNL